MEIGWNEKCPSGSGLKYKKCCLNKKDEFGMLFWGLADLYEISTNEFFAMLSHTTFDLFIS